MILKFLRLLKIFTVVIKYGLDEIAMSGLQAVSYTHLRAHET